MITRRSLLEAVPALLLTAATLRAEQSASTSIDVHIAAETGARVPPDFTGLGYEISSAARPHLLSADNEIYVRLVRQLGPRGVLRLGGIVADFSRFDANGLSRFEPKHTVITRADLTRLRGFLDRTNWTAIWSVNFGSGTLAEAIDQARAVRELLGARLLAIELGNEVDNYGHGAIPLRTPPYTFGSFREEYAQWRAAILSAVPGLPFAAPDAAGDSGWLEQMAASAHADVQLLTQHYYRGDQRKGTADQLLRPDPALAAHLDRLRTVSQKSGIPWRMCETNSFYGGGRPGISDTLIGALWTLDFMLLLAAKGCAGVNMETGFNQLGFLSSYSPIRNSEDGAVSVGAAYYGMLAFAQSVAAGGSVAALSPAPAMDGLTAYTCTRASGPTTVVLVNRGGGTLSVRIPGMRGRFRRMLLEGPSLTSTTGIRLGGAEVDSSGAWSPMKSLPMTLHEGDGIQVAAYTAMVIHST